MFRYFHFSCSVIVLALLGIALCCATGFAQEITDYTALGDDSYAQRLGLSDEQIAQVARVLDERRNAIVTAKPDARAEIFDRANKQLSTLLTEAQRKAFSALVSGGKLRFNFRGEPWGEVLQWFASQADLALVMNEVPPGTFTYSDAKNHSPTQAIDLLNSVLQSKGFTLVRREKMLIVAQISSGLPYDLVPKVLPEDLNNRGRFEYVSVLFPLQGRAVEQVSQEVSAFLGPNARATPLPTTGQLMVVDTAGRVDAIRKLIESIPIPKKKEQAKPNERKAKEKPPAPVFQVHSAKGLNMGSALQTLEKLFGDAKFTGDPKANQITAFTSPNHQTAIAQTLQQMTANVSGDNEPRLEIYAVTNQDLDQLQNLLAQANPGVQVSGDAAGQRLLVVGDSEQQEDVVRTLQKLDAVELGGEATNSVTVYEVETSLADQLITLLQPLIPRANIVQNGPRIAVRGSARDQQIAQSAIEQLELAEENADQPTLRFYQLARPLAEAYLNTIRELAPKAKISTIPNRNQLAIVATESDFTRLVEALRRTEAELAQEQTPQLQPFDVRVDDAERLLGMLQAKFPQTQMLLNQAKDQLLVWTNDDLRLKIEQQLAELQAVLPAKRVEAWQGYSTEVFTADNMEALLRPVVSRAQFKPDPQRKRMMVLGTEEEHTKIRETLAAFQGEDVNNADFEDVLLGYPINRGDPDAVVQMLTDMYPDLRFNADQRANKVFVTATLADHKRVKAVIDQLDTAPGDADELAKSYAVKTLTPAVVLQLLSPSFPEMRFSPNNASKQLAAIGSSRDHEKLRQAIEQLDAEGSQGRVEAYHVGSANAAIVRSILLQLVPAATVSANSKNQTVVVWADDQDHAKIKRAVEQFIKTPEDERQTKVYQLNHASPNIAEYILRDLMPEARFVDDRQTGILTATAFADEHVQIADVLRQMDVPRQSQQTTEIYRFDRTNARSAESVFERLAPRARVSMVYGTNSVIATANEADHGLFREAAEKLNGGNTESVTRVYTLDKKQINVDDVLGSLDDALESRVAIRMNEQTNSLIVRGSPEDQATMKELIDELISQVPPTPQRVANVYHLQHADPEAAVDVMRGLLEDTNFRFDRQTGTLTATALPDQQTEIAKVLQQLDVPGQQRQRITEIYRFDRTDARSAESTFERLIPTARVSSIRGTNSIVVTATEAEHKVFRETADKLNGAGTQSVTKVYPLDRDQIDAEDVLASIDDSLMSRMSVRVNEAMNGLIVRGSEEDQVTMKQLVDEIVAQVPPIKKQVAKVYQFANADGDSVQYALRDMFDDASFSFDWNNRTLLATASEEEQLRIAAFVKQLDQPRPSNKLTKTYKLHSFPASRMDNLVEDLVTNGEVSYDNETNVLLVTATEQDHVKVQAAVDNVNLTSNTNATEHVYTLKSANPMSIASALDRIIPNARVASDMESRTLIVSAAEDDQQRVQELINQLDAAPGRESTMRAYVVQHADSKQTFESLQKTFNGNGDFSLSFQEPSKTIFAVATPKNHEIFSDLLSQLDTPVLAESDRTAQTYPLTSMSGNAARSAMTALLQGTLPAATVELDELANSLVVVGTAQQHMKVATALGQLSTHETELEVFELAYVDPWTVESAIDTLFANQPAAAAPSITSDYFSQRLFVRGSPNQIDQVRTVLRKMGETTVAKSKENKGGDIRTIPYRGDVKAAVKQIEQIWPRIRKNRIQVVAPSDPNFKIQTPQPLDLEADEDEQENSVKRGSWSRTRYIAVQESTRAPTADGEQRTATTTDAETGDDENSPVVIVPEGDRITIASSDHEALDQLEELLSVMARAESNETGAMGNDFAVFLLRNTGASSTRQLLADLFQQLRKTSGNSSSSGSRGPMDGGFSLFGPKFGNVAVVADDRLNALIIHGDRKERELIEELLSVLDSEDLPNPIVVFQPELVRLDHTQAQRVYDILKNVYRSQLSSGGGRKKVEIPEGVSSEVATVLQQINAAAGAPILTLDVDETTNSIIMRAPPELRKEIKLFVESLDQSAGNNRSRNVRVIQIQQGKSDQIREALQQFILQRNQRN